MSVVRCPRCRDEVTVPPHAGSGSLVRCPLCLEQYLLSEALANAPPPLILLSRGAEAPLIEEEAIRDGEYQLAGGISSDVFNTGAPTAAATVARPAIRGTRPRRKEKSAIGELVKIVLGGVLGLTIGLLVLWYAFGRDPLNAGPTIARYVPWAVPAQFRGKPAPAAVEGISSSDKRNGVVAVDGGGNLRDRKPRREEQGKTSGDLQAVPTLDLQPLPRPGDLQIFDPLDDLKRPANRELKIENPLNDAKPKDEVRRSSRGMSGVEPAGRVELSSAALPDDSQATQPMPDLTDLLDVLPFKPVAPPSELPLP